MGDEAFAARRTLLSIGGAAVGFPEGFDLSHGKDILGVRLEYESKSQ